MLGAELSLYLLRAIVPVSIQQALITEPVTRLLEVLLYST